VALIELFAWMTDMLLYRVNQVPDKAYVKFLELIGVRLEPPRPARAEVTFYLSAPQAADVVIPEETEVATVRTESNEAVVFSTETALTIRPPVLRGALTRSAGGGANGSGGGATWIVHDLRKLDLPHQKIVMFSPRPVPGDAFVLALERDHSQHVLALVVECELAGGAGVDPTNPPTVWEVYQGPVAGWAPCVVEYDGTGGFNRSGEIILRLPAMVEREIEGLRAYWLRCRLTDAEASAGGYHVSPEIEKLRLEARGGTATVRHATTAHDEILGQSDGTPGQSFRLLHTPVLALDPDRDYLAVAPPGGAPERWQAVPDFADSGPEDRHFTLDCLDGTLTLGPSLLQPDGTVYRFGGVPPKGSLLRFHRYQHGGGIAGNVPQHTLTVPKSSIPYLARVTNWQPAVGGRDAQSLDDAKLRAPQVLRTRTRAVTVDDYEYLARQIPGVARARCLAPGAQPGDGPSPKPGEVVVYIVPQVDDSSGKIPAEQLARSAELRARVLAYLNERRPLGTSIDVRLPQYIWVSVQAVLRLPEGSDSGVLEAAQRAAERELYRFLNPLTGGPQSDGWPFGRDLSVSEIYGLLQRVPAVEFVEDVRLGIAEHGGLADPQAALPRLVVPRHGLICSAQHRVTALPRDDA
jgi:predicted phage baseplate assembly protein